MADINIERKEGTNIWPLLIIGLVLLAVLAWWLMQRQGGDRVVTETPDGLVADTVRGTDVGTPRGTARPVNSFLGFVEDNRARDEVSLDHEYAHDGVRRLADAIGELREDGERAATQSGQAATGNIEQHIEQMRAHADSLQREETSARHANHTRAAFTNAASAMEILVQRYYPNVSSEVQQVRQSANAVNQGTPLLQQKQQVQTFFDRSATALRAMALTDTDADRRAGVVRQGQTGTTGQQGTTPRQ